MASERIKTERVSVTWRSSSTFIDVLACQTGGGIHSTSGQTSQDTFTDQPITCITRVPNDVTILESSTSWSPSTVDGCIRILTGVNCNEKEIQNCSLKLCHQSGNLGCPQANTNVEKSNSYSLLLLQRGVLFWGFPNPFVLHCRFGRSYRKITPWRNVPVHLPAVFAFLPPTLVLVL